MVSSALKKMSYYKGKLFFLLFIAYINYYYYYFYCLSYVKDNRAICYDAHLKLRRYDGLMQRSTYFNSIFPVTLGVAYVAHCI